MSMTLQEAAIKSCEDRIKHLESTPIHHYGKRQRERAIELERVKIAALRPITREQVEKVFSGCPACNDRRCTSCRCFGWYEEVCRKCENQSGYQPLKFCPHCGKPLRDKALDMVMERLEALRDE